MLHAFGVQGRSGSLRDNVNEIVLEILRNSRDKSDTHRCREQSADTADKLRGRVFIEARRVAVNDVAENQRVEKGKNLVDGGEEKGDQHQPPVSLQMSKEQGHAY